MTSAPATPLTHSGTLLEFVGSRQVEQMDLEKLRDFAHEFYGILTQIVCDEDNRFSNHAIMSLAWRFAHCGPMTGQEGLAQLGLWLGELTPREGKLLGTIEVLWA